MFIYLAAPGLSCGMIPDQGSNPGPLYWECGVSTTGPPEKSLYELLSTAFPHLSTPMTRLRKI